MAVIITLVGLDSNYWFSLAGFVVGPDFVLIDVDFFLHIFIFGGPSRTRTEDYPVMSGGL